MKDEPEIFNKILSNQVEFHKGFPILIQGVPKRIQLGFIFITMGTRKQLTPDLFYMKIDIHTYILNTKTFMSDLYPICLLKN